MYAILSSAKLQLAASWQRMIGACSSLSRSTLAWVGLGLAAVILLSVNLLASVNLRNWQADLTEGSVFTISDGTRQILSGIDEPISVQLYFSKRLGEMAPSHARYFERVQALLERYRDLSGGKLQVSYLDPEPFSDAEDRAVAAGLQGRRLNAEGELGYFGLVARNSTDNVEVIPFFSPDRGAFLEYDVTKLVNTLANPKKHVVGVISGLPLNGGKMPMSEQPTPPWLIMDQLREFFDVKMIDANISSVPSDVDVLMIVQPLGLEPKAAYAIDQYVLGGGKALVLVDPMPESAYLATIEKSAKGLDEIKRLIKAWGLEFDDNQVAVDIAHARRVQFGRDADSVTEFVSWLGLDKRNIDEGDVLSAGIETLNVASAGFLKRVEGAGPTVRPLLHTSPQAMKVEAKQVGMTANPIALLRSYKPLGYPLVIGARVTGTAQSAFPDGPPKPADGDASAKDAATGDDKKGSAPTVGAKHLASGKVNAIVIADTDVMADQFWVDRRELLGQQVVMPTAHNPALIIGALENLSGNDAMIALRARGVTDRPFTKVEELRRDAERQFREKEQALTQKLQSLEKELTQLSSSDGAMLMSDKERQAAERFRAEMLATRRELREVKLALRRDIDRLDGYLKFANIALVPLAIGLGGAGYTLWRMRRRTRSKH
jgi:ABC-type uncharacterized transport system involved in gliding motility auxiliary subunit